MNPFDSQFYTNRECVQSQPNMNNETPLPYPRFISQSTFKRQRDHTFDSDALTASQKQRRSTAFETSAFASLIDPEHVSQIQQQQSETDRFVSQQTEMLRLELQARQQTRTLMLASALQAVITKRLKAKDEEIARMGKLNWDLQEQAKSLCVESEMWRDLALTSEAAANSLRSNIEQLLAQFDGDGLRGHVEEDAESSCGSCEGADVRPGGCRGCGVRRASVLVLPCSHLCLCTVCGSAPLQSCPVCATVMNASVHVNMP